MTLLETDYKTDLFDCSISQRAGYSIMKCGVTCGKHSRCWWKVNSMATWCSLQTREQQDKQKHHASQWYESLINFQKWADLSFAHYEKLCITGLSIFKVVNAGDTSVSLPFTPFLSLPIPLMLIPLKNLPIGILELPFPSLNPTLSWVFPF